MTTHWYVPEPCDTAEPDTIPVLPGGYLDLIRQIPDSELQRIEDVDVALEGVL
ncbi:hypothetical protein [Streptomyces sp. NRRL S-813]|uniref:hypothetical protein n=1 Tax=Streptomyces sp. NRRL S-813 TaxID=1463919 RepID=UPI000A9C451F|nr:hypothetical protein [Streptomyces sp. NRRL S-813]